MLVSTVQRKRYYLNKKHGSQALQEQEDAPQEDVVQEDVLRFACYVKNLSQAPELVRANLRGPNFHRYYTELFLLKSHNHALTE